MCDFRLSKIQDLLKSLTNFQEFFLQKIFWDCKTKYYEIAKNKNDQQTLLILYIGTSIFIKVQTVINSNNNFDIQCKDQIDAGLRATLKILKNSNSLAKVLLEIFEVNASLIKDKNKDLYIKLNSPSYETRALITIVYEHEDSSPKLGEYKFVSIGSSGKIGSFYFEKGRVRLVHSQKSKIEMSRKFINQVIRNSYSSLSNFKIFDYDINRFLSPKIYFPPSYGDLENIRKLFNYYSFLGAVNDEKGTEIINYFESSYKKSDVYCCFSIFIFLIRYLTTQKNVGNYQNSAYLYEEFYVGYDHMTHSSRGLAVPLVFTNSALIFAIKNLAKYESNRIASYIAINDPRYDLFLTEKDLNIKHDQQSVYEAFRIFVKSKNLQPIAKSLVEIYADKRNSINKSKIIKPKKD